MNYDCTIERVNKLMADWARLSKSGTINIDTIETGYETLAREYNLPTWVVRAVIHNQTTGEYIRKRIQETVRKDLESGELRREELQSIGNEIVVERLEQYGVQTFGRRQYLTPEQREEHGLQGLYWRKIREGRGVDESYIADILQLDRNLLRLFEDGSISHDDMPEGFLQGFAWLLCAEEELEKFKGKYNIQ